MFTLSSGVVWQSHGHEDATGNGTTTILTFDFETSTGDLFFNYVWASEEYNEFVDEGFSDTFSLTVDGVNVALIPGTAIPVEIDTVNLGDFPEFFNSNSPRR